MASASNSNASRTSRPGCGPTSPPSPGPTGPWWSRPASGTGWRTYWTSSASTSSWRTRPGLKAIAAAKVKTGHLDADLLAQLLWADFIPAAHRIGRDARGPRDLMRLRLRLVEQRSQVHNSIERIREKFAVIRPDQLDPWYHLQVLLHEEQITLLTQHIQDLEATLHPVLLPTADVQRLLWIPGIGKVNAFTIWTEIDDITRLPTEKQFLSYSRLVPGAANSGGKTRARPGAKQGNRYLKIAFSHASVRAIQYYPVIKAFITASAAANRSSSRGPSSPPNSAGLPIRC